MSTVNPKGVALAFGTEERHLLFDYAVIAEIQEAYDSDVVSVIRQMFLDKASPGEYRAKILVDLVHKLLVDEAERERYLNGIELKSYTKKQVGWMLNRGNADDAVKAIIDAWQVSIPAAEDDGEDDGDDDPNSQRGTERA